jgi:hypothetical protein
MLWLHLRIFAHDVYRGCEEFEAWPFSKHPLLQTFIFQKLVVARVWDVTFGLNQRW